MFSFFKSAQLYLNNVNYLLDGIDVHVFHEYAVCTALPTF